MGREDIGWELWRSFLAVMKERSLSGAARSLRVSQPTIGRHIDQLETALGSRLFTRAQNGLTPTDMALTLQPQAEDMAAAAEAIIRMASGDADAETGVVRISATENMSSEMLPTILEPFLRAHPNIEIEIDASNRNVDILRRDADIAVRMHRPEQGALLARRLGTMRMAFYATEDYFTRHLYPQKPEDLAGHRLIGPDRDQQFRARVTESLPQLAKADFSYRTDHQTVMLAAVRAGIGIGICPIAIAKREPGLVPVLPEIIHLDIETWLTMHQDLRNNRRIKMVFDHVADSLQQLLK